MRPVPNSLHDEAASRLREQIFAGALPPGRFLDEAALHQRLQQFASEGLIADYYEANYAIHEAFITLADNRWLAQVIGDLRKILRLARAQTLHVPGRLQQSLAEHLAVFAALKARDCDAAEEAMRNHLLRQRDA